MGVVVFERRPFWAPELRYEFQREAIDVRACRSLEDAVGAAGRSVPSTVLLLDFSAAADACLHWLGSGRRPQGIAVLVFLPGRMRELEWAVREIGVETILTDETSPADAAEICRRQLRSELALGRRAGVGTP